MTEPKLPAGRLVGAMLGDFQIVRLVGSGGMGEVYEAVQMQLDRKVALKVLRDEWVSDPVYLKRFHEEARAVARLQHANIVSVFTIGEQAGTHYIAMEFVDGRTLRDQVSRHGALEEKEAIAILKKAVAALGRAHEEGLIHRDVKPENIMLTRRVGARVSEVKVADFGLARDLNRRDASLTQSGMTMGTPLYMSPEQVRGKPLDSRTDWYSLGVTAYHLLAGEPPYQGNEPLAVAVQHLQGNAAPLEELRPELSPELCGIVRKMMAVELTDRYASAADILRDLQRVRPGVQGEPTVSVDTSEAKGAGTGDSLPSTRAIVGVHAVSGPTKVPPLNSAAGRLSITMNRVNSAMTDRRRAIWATSLVLAASLLGGVASAWMFRESDPLRTPPPAASSRRPRTDDRDLVPDPRSHLEDARKQTDPDLRERKLWSVLDHHGENDADAEVVTLDAAVDLMNHYFSRHEYDLVLEVADVLQAPLADKELKVYGKLMKGFVECRRGNAPEATEHFTQALKGEPGVSVDLFDVHRIEAMALEFHRCLAKIGGPKSQSLSDQFWKRFQIKRNTGL